MKITKGITYENGVTSIWRKTVTRCKNFEQQLYENQRLRIVSFLILFIKANKWK